MGSTIWRGSSRTRAVSRGRNEEWTGRTAPGNRFRAPGGMADDGQHNSLWALVHCATRVSADTEPNPVRRVQTGVPDPDVHDIGSESAGGLHRLLLYAARAG